MTSRTRRPGSEVVDDLFGLSEEITAAPSDEELAEFELDLETIRALGELTAPRSGLVDRMERRVGEILAARDAVAAVADLFGLAWRTAVVLIDADQDV